ncbi:hypothetical protein Cri9333_4170 [Crinalium epipsammum PCC 9333]|uniref:Uncharacterized protein n=1 Tax=Crinalium epipsammum PCC 9333 TaxID=1173022 RepID=K9W5D0_9CYAN|nr:hypothetical protein [Crinalium epipsammum]AFZ14962.1 hypothetical protein Cri9333_4170 [Crinalium epipsammum PCC 9333]
MENQPSSSNQEESETCSQVKIITSDSIQSSYNPICCPQNSPLSELREAQIIEENKLNCNWTLQKIKVVPYPQPEFHINHDKSTEQAGGQRGRGGRGAEGQRGRGS